MDALFIAPYLISSDDLLRMVSITINSDYRPQTPSLSSAMLKASGCDDLQAIVHLVEGRMISGGHGPREGSGM